MSLFSSIFGGDSGKVDTPKLEDYIPLIQAQADTNRVNQVTPFGGIRYVQPEGPEALSFDDWKAQNPMEPISTGGSYQWEGGKGGSNVWVPAEAQAPDYQSAYDSYLADFDKNNPAGQPTAEVYFSPEFESLFNQQFDPDAYNQYGDDYMSNAERYLNPIYDRQKENFIQAMANRGQPVGGEEYNDQYELLTDAQNKGWENAAFTAQQLSDKARLEDYNRLMSAMGLTGVAVPQIDTLGAANLAMNANAANAAIDANNSSNIWNTVAGIGGAYIGGQPDWLFN